MKKIKKILGSLGIFLVGLKSKVLASYPQIQEKFVEVKYGTFEPTIAEKFSIIAKIVLPIILFFIGLGVILSKKLSKKIKTIIIVVFICVGILAITFIKRFIY